MSGARNSNAPTVAGEYVVSAALGKSMSQGTVAAEAGTLNNDTSSAAVWMLQADTSNRIYCELLQTATARDVVQSGGSNSFDASHAPVALDGSIHKLALAWAPNDFAAVLNGGAVITDNAGTVPVVHSLFLGPANSVLNGCLRRLRYWKTRLPDSQLQSLTAP